MVDDYDEKNMEHLFCAWSENLLLIFVPQGSTSDTNTDTISIDNNNKTQNMCIEWWIMKGNSEPYIWREAEKTPWHLSDFIPMRRKYPHS